MSASRSTISRAWASLSLRRSRLVLNHPTPASVATSEGIMTDQSSTAVGCFCVEARARLCHTWQLAVPYDIGYFVGFLPAGYQRPKGFLLLVGSGVGGLGCETIQAADVGDMERGLVPACSTARHSFVVDDCAVGGCLGEWLQLLPGAVLVDNSMIAVVLPALDIEEIMRVVFFVAASVGVLSGAVDYDTSGFGHGVFGFTLQRYVKK